MEKSASRRGRAHNAEGARAAILDAAEQVFAEQGFDGARVDTIAERSSYNKSLIFQYFGDKLSLYAAVIRRADEQTRDLQEQAFDALLDESALTPEKIVDLLRTFLNGYFDYLVQHPRIARIYLWEMAEGWQTYEKIVTQRDVEEADRLRRLTRKLQANKLLRADIEPLVHLFLMQFFYPCYLAIIPLFEKVLPGEDFSSPDARVHARDAIVNFAVHGFMVDFPDQTR